VVIVPCDRVSRIVLVQPSVRGAARHDVRGADRFADLACERTAEDRKREEEREKATSHRNQV
jgi:hypothetical protein